MTKKPKVKRDDERARARFARRSKEDLIAWAEKEIREYKKFIKALKDRR